MSRMKTMLLGLVAVMALSSMVSASASATELQGPWWRHAEQGKQVKLWPQNKEYAIVSENQGPFILRGSVGSGGTTPVIIECRKVENTGVIWNGAHQGQDEAEVKFTECFTVTPCAGESVMVETAKVYTELMWKYKGEIKELKEVGQQKIYDVFAPMAAPIEGKVKFTKIVIPLKCGVAAGSFDVQARGTEAKFIDQKQEPHNIRWGTAAEVAPQNQDAKVGYLIWRVPNQTKLHHQETPIEARLTFGGNPAELEGYIKVKLVSEEEFGAFNE